MVRLKGRICFRHRGGKHVFQFLMVRLKDIHRTNVRQIRIFQFLMVRLKGCAGTGRRYRHGISIPYGSIKRCRERESLPIQTRISIPYGSIKSSSPRFRPRRGSAISIPYGSIKRCRPRSRSAFKFISIPYGSIKSEEFIDIVTRGEEFQFLMVRLKVRFSWLEMYQYDISIPYGSIKS